LLWRDKNANGISEAGELASLTEAGIAGINLALTPTGQTLENTPGNVLFNTASFDWADGREGLVGDVALRYRPLDPADPSDGVSPPAVAAGPAPTPTRGALTRDGQLNALIQSMAAFDARPGVGDLGALAPLADRETPHLATPL
ncbi:MAG: hypothetical protein AAGF19_05045, partial [Pseudomonadota bacterium]